MGTPPAKQLQLQKYCRVLMSAPKKNPRDSLQGYWPICVEFCEDVQKPGRDIRVVCVTVEMHEKTLSRLSRNNGNSA